MNVNPRFCKKCSYDLRATTSICPECGHPFDSANPKTYLLRPPGAAWKWLRRIALSLLLLALIPAAPVAWLWFGWHSEKNEIQAIPAEHISSLQRTDAYPRLSKFLPARLRFLTERVTNVSTSEATDADLSRLVKLKRMIELDLRSQQVTDAGLAHLAAMTQLKTLRLGSITDSGLEHLAAMPRLEVLFIENTQITDAGLAHLAKIPTMKVLGLRDTHITDAGLAHLSGLTQIQILLLDGTPITDAGLAHLSGMTQMGYLHLRRTQITDAGLAHLSELAQMHWLFLSDTKVTDAGLAHLSRMTLLQQLDLTNTQVTNAAVAELQTSMPQAKIVHNSRP